MKKKLITVPNRNNQLILKGQRHRVEPPTQIEWLIQPDGTRTLYPDSYLATILSASHTDLSWIRESGESIRPRATISTDHINPVGINHTEAWDKIAHTIHLKIEHYEEKKQALIESGTNPLEASIRREAREVNN